MALKPPVEVPQGAIRLNTDSQKLEFFAQDQWWEMATQVSAGSAPRGWMQNVNLGTPGTGIQFVDFTTTGDAADWGELTTNGVHAAAGCSSLVRGFAAGGRLSSGNPWAQQDTINYWNFSTQGNALDFGNLVQAIGRNAGCSDSTRGISGGGQGSNNMINYWTMSSTGNAIDFGNLTNGRETVAATSSPTRGIFAGGGNGSEFNYIDYIIYQTTGDAKDFGDLVSGNTRQMNGNVSSPVRGVFSGNGSYIGCRYIEIATLGNSMEFGDLSQNRAYNCASGSSIRGVVAGGTTPSYQTTMDYYQIASTGNLADFGDLQEARGRQAALSNGHGGL